MPRSGSHSQVHLSLQSCARCCVRTLNCREESRRQAPSTSPLTALSPNGANSGNSTALLSWLDVSTDTPPTASAPQIFILIFQHPLGMQDVLPAFSLDLHPAFFLSFRGATPLHVPCGKAGVVIFTAEKTSKAVERDVGEKCEWNPLASQDRCAHRVSEGHSIGAVQKWSGTGEAARGWEVAVH